MKFISKIKKNIIEWFENLNLLEDEIKNLIKDLWSYKNKPKNIILFIILLPVTLIFLIINLLVFFIFLFFYFIQFFFKKIQSKLKPKKRIVIKYKKRFKFLKNFHLIIFEKILITFPKKKAFLIFYIILKKFVENDKKNEIELDFLKKWIKSISNRYLILFITGLPYILLYCNNELLKNFLDLRNYNYEGSTKYKKERAFINAVLLNIYKNLIPNYNKLVEKLKIIIKNKKIKFNSKKEIIKLLKYTKRFEIDFNNIKKSMKFNLVKHKITKNNFTKQHPTIMTNLHNNKIQELVYSNETKSEYLEILEYNKEKKTLELKKIRNIFFHSGSLNKNKKTFYTKPILTESENILITNPENNSKIILDISEENINNSIANLTINLNEKLLITEKMEIKNETKNKIIKKENSLKFINWVMKNKNSIKTECFESLLSIEDFWKENEIILQNMNIEEKLILAKELGVGIEYFEDCKEANFQIFKSFISKNIK